MKPIFDDSGLAIEAGDIRCFYYDSLTAEYIGWSDEFIHAGVSMPGHSTDTEPGDDLSGMVSVFNGVEWKSVEDNRGKTVYSKISGKPEIVNYIGEIKADFVTIPPATPYDKWNGKAWVTDTEAQHMADVEAAEQQRAALLVEAQESISIWQTELQLGIISDDDKASLISWLAYIKALKAVDTSNAPDVSWPMVPYHK